MKKPKTFFDIIKSKDPLDKKKVELVLSQFKLFYKLRDERKKYIDIKREEYHKIDKKYNNIILEIHKQQAICENQIKLLTGCQAFSKLNRIFKEKLEKAKSINTSNDNNNDNNKKENTEVN